MYHYISIDQRVKKIYILQGKRRHTASNAAEPAAAAAATMTYIDRNKVYDASY